MNNSLGTALVGLGAFLSLLGAAFAQDAAFSTHAWVIFIVLALGAAAAVVFAGLLLLAARLRRLGTALS